MPLMHCMECHHEWESTHHESLCDWCGEAGYILEEETGLQKLTREVLALVPTVSEKYLKIKASNENTARMENANVKNKKKGSSFGR